LCADIMEIISKGNYCIDTLKYTHSIRTVSKVYKRRNVGARCKTSSVSHKAKIWSLTNRKTLIASIISIEERKTGTILHTNSDGRVSIR